jgi:photosystem I subunit 10
LFYNILGLHLFCYSGDKSLISSILLAAAASLPTTPVWSPTVGIIISVSSILSVLLALKIQYPLVGPKLPILPISIPAFVGAMAFGHIIGIGIVLGLTNIGRI